MGSAQQSHIPTISTSYALEPADKFPLTDECKHYEGKHQVPWDIQNQIAKEMTSIDSSKDTLIDVFAGAGGNTIAFALSQRWKHIVAIERDPSTLACAQNNAELYEVDPSLITWIHADSFEYLDLLKSRPQELHPDLRIDTSQTVLFASPPWGGPGYSTDEVFDLRNMQPYNLDKLHSAYKSMDHVLFLPRTSDIRQIARLGPGDGKKVDVVQYCMEGASKAMVAYIPSSGDSE
ncbi:putative diacylglycerol O-acyltransferase tgs1 [Conoideocrella luteorostrata]|uniref:Trimethylguanosine synthase n=1 Tax=Conoideocrella luteorostrata TaxID=1105319 RepID=A0AAJ0CWT4_9HYPO|nr:putative diacylglycerol O-acyltransferase tgs1 [Conoideocrella luteorostrata]